MQLPNETQRIVIVGRNGTGKTQAGVWHLSKQNWQVMPWIIFNWKRDKLIEAIPGAQFIDLETLPQEPGVYIVTPTPDQGEQVDALLWAIWQQENIGVYVDEGYMLANGRQYSPAYRAIQTQGRSKHIPTITLSQRPVALDRFVFSETNFYQVFALNDKNDRKRISEWIPDYDPNENLPKFHSWYYDVDNNELAILQPVPKAREILKTFMPPDEVIEVSQPQNRLIYV